VGAFGRDALVSASPIDLLSHFRFGLMATAQARWKRLVLPLDVIWARFGDDKGLPSVGLGAATANVKASVFILTPKVGVRLLDEPKIKCDFLTGFRYWHLGQSLNFSPSILNLNFSSSQSWVDPLVGGRIESPLSSKLVAAVFGDVGGWGTGSQLEYQVGGTLGYKVKENVTLQAGYRYLDVNYRGGGLAQPVFDTHLSGVALGVTFNLK
jgi:opacity protein-like surface antigen